ncbi:MAG: molybdopterin-guanine dinucleotide biosynthesis protein B [Metallosphaera sp.]
MDCIFQIIGKKNSGKTLVMEKAISLLRAKGLVVAAIKHTHHVINPEGKDTSRYSKAGANLVILHSNDCAMFWKCENLDYLDFIPADVILIEGFANLNLGVKLEISNPNEAEDIAARISNLASECSKSVRINVIPEQKDKIKYMTLYNLMRKWGIREVRVLDD